MTDFVKDQPCKFKIIQETLDSDPNTISVSRNRLENEKNILLKLQSTHAEGAKFHVLCLAPRLNWNDSDQEEVQDLYLRSSEGSIKNDGNSKPRVCGLVLESGGLNLAEFLRDPLHSPSRFGIIARVNILKEIVDALEFLEKHRIVHGDLKPENIVSFHRGNGTTCWKLIDFDNSHDLTSLSSRSPPKIDLQNPFLTPEYIPPELASAVREVKLNRLNSPNQQQQDPLFTPTHKLDIWSLGLVSVFVLKGQSLWDLYPSFNLNTRIGVGRSSNVDLSPIIDFSEDHFNRTWLSVQCGEKEKSFLVDCFRVDPNNRWSASKLARKSIFSTGQATILLGVREINVEIRNQMVQLTQLVDQGVTLGQFTDALTTLMNELQIMRG